jgi:EAL domain-containing protein (putative c-di-GMP-specific phosphodiesterase class I)/GGDEF domain-containing protein
VTDGLVTYGVTRDVRVGVLGFGMYGYMVAMALMAFAARRPIRVTEARAILGPSKAILAALGLALTGPASVMVPWSVRPAVWAIAVFLVWRLLAQVRIHGQSETDPLSGFLEGRAFARHVGGVVQAASSTRPALLIAVDLDGFGRWNAQHGYSAGDALLTDLAARLEGSSLTGGVWSRLGADRFAWIGIGHEGMNGRLMAETVHDIAAANTGGLPARAAFVVLPDDAETAANAIAAAEEALAAAQSGDRRVVAFDRGRLDGLEYTSGYSASLAQRRAAILELLREPETISTVFQPIVSLADGATLGFESLSRFRAEPARPPDKWIAEAHAVGLGLEIEVECVRRACRHRDTIPGDAYLSVNMSPEAILFPEMDEALGTGSLEGLVIEITEHEAVGDYARLASRLADYRGRGALVAIDDTGAGHASMRHVTQLAPDYIKVDRSLIHDLHLDHAKRALVRSMVTLEKELGASVVAEGIESAEELQALRELGVPLGQGFLLARPRPEAVPAPWCSASLELAGPVGRAEA